MPVFGSFMDDDGRLHENVALYYVGVVGNHSITMSGVRADLSGCVELDENGSYVDYRGASGGFRNFTTHAQTRTLAVNIDYTNRDNVNVFDNTDGVYLIKNGVMQGGGINA